MITAIIFILIVAILAIFSILPKKKKKEITIARIKGSVETLEMLPKDASWGDIWIVMQPFPEQWIFLGKEWSKAPVMDPDD